MTDNERLADLLFGSNGLTPEDCELRFPPRELPEGARDSKGQHVANLLQFAPDESIQTVLSIPNYEESAADLLI